MDLQLSPDQFDILTALVAGDILFSRGEKWYLSTPARSSKGGEAAGGDRRRRVKHSAVSELIQRGLIARQPGNYFVTDLGLELLIDAQERMTADLTASLDDKADDSNNETSK